MDTPSLPEMKWAMTRYKAGKAQKKAFKKDGEWDARASRARDKDSGCRGGGGKKKRSPSRRRVDPLSGASCASAVEQRGTWPRSAASAGRTSTATPAGGKGIPSKCD